MFKKWQKFKEEYNSMILGTGNTKEMSDFDMLIDDDD